MKIIPTLIYDLAVDLDQRAVISFEVYKLHPGRYYRNCFDPLDGVAPVVIEDWHSIRMVDYKLFFSEWREPDYRSNLRGDLDRFLMNSQPRKCLHVSLDDHRAPLTYQFLARHFNRLQWQGELNLQIIDRTATRDVQGTARMVGKFFSGYGFAVLEYHRQLISGPPDSPAVMYDLGSTGFSPQHYLHDPPHQSS